MLKQPYSNYNLLSKQIVKKCYEQFQTTTTLLQPKNKNKKSLQ